mmetsp:Transcript_6235/g.20984  ORF Transcript_6235/g.20984 Transcript_6235/m.20984 type:complete len:248 (+) Transcript_6235:362-1105(+)
MGNQGKAQQGHHRLDQLDDGRVRREEPGQVHGDYPREHGVEASNQDPHAKDLRDEAPDCGRHAAERERLPQLLVVRRVVLGAAGLGRGHAGKERLGRLGQGVPKCGEEEEDPDQDLVRREVVRAAARGAVREGAVAHGLAQERQEDWPCEPEEAGELALGGHLDEGLRLRTRAFQQRAHEDHRGDALGDRGCHGGTHHPRVEHGDEEHVPDQVNEAGDEHGKERRDGILRAQARRLRHHVQQRCRCA